jgi:hypothetical protein
MRSTISASADSYLQAHYCGPAAQFKCEASFIADKLDDAQHRLVRVDAAPPEPGCATQVILVRFEELVHVTRKLRIVLKQESMA